MSTYRILSGEAYEVTANTEEEALAKFYVALGHEDEEDYEGYKYNFADLDNDVQYVEVDTVIVDGTPF